MLLDGIIFPLLLLLIAYEDCGDGILSELPATDPVVYNGSIDSYMVEVSLLSADLHS